MKTAVSVPDRLFRQIDRLAKRMKKSRSQLYAEALAEYALRHANDEIEEAMNKALSEIDQAEPDAALRREHGRRRLLAVEW